MKCWILASLLLVPLVTGCSQVSTVENTPAPPPSTPPPPHFPAQIKNIVIVVQENRTPDNLFHELGPACPLPQNAPTLQACIPVNVTSSCYDISPCGISNKSGVPQIVTLSPLAFAGTPDADHSHAGFMHMCDPDPVTSQCRNDGTWRTALAVGVGDYSYTYVQNDPVTNSDGSSGHFLDPYLTLAKSYGWANYMFQTNQGPSYPAHQYLFSGTSAITAEDDAASRFIAEGNNVDASNVGCLTLPNAPNYLVAPTLGRPTPGCTLYYGGSVQECAINNTALIYPTNPVGTFCYPRKSMADLLDPQSISWKYYATGAVPIWTAPLTMQNICQPAFVDPIGNPSSTLKCTGQEWSAHVDVNHRGVDVLRDIANCNLSQVSWVTPDGEWSDHPGAYNLFGPSWVAAVVNAIGNNPTCPGGTPDAGQNYWQDTAIIITWDDWGGWTDNQPPPLASKLPCTSSDCKGDYELGFRVPLIVVSAYTPEGYIDNSQNDFGSILRFIEGVNHLGEGALGFADQRSATDLQNFFTLTTPRPYQTIPAPKDAKFFLNVNGASIAPDND